MAAPNHGQQPDAAGSSPGMFQVIALGGRTDDQQTWEYKRRKPHRKSRGGCQGCKQRRVKCDQEMPACLRCRRNQRTCIYEGGGGGGSGTGGASSSASSHSDGQTPQDGTPAGSSTASAASRNAPQPARQSTPTAVRIKREFEEDAIADSQSSMVAYSASAQVPRALRASPLQIQLREYGTPSNLLLHHFDVAGDGIFDMPNFVGPLIPLALQFPHLRGTILAAAATHLSHKAPEHPDYRIAQHYQHCLALRDYQTALNTPFKVHGQLGVDVLLVTALLINMLAFSMPIEAGDTFADWDNSRQAGLPPPCPDPDPDPRRSWVFSTKDSRLDWLALQLGLTPLLVAAAPWRENSRLRLMYANSDDEQRTLSGTWQSLSRVPRHWLKLFGLNPKSRPIPGFRGTGIATPAPTTPPGGSPSSAGGSPESTSTTATADMISEADRIYRAPLRVAAELQRIEPTERNMLQYFQFLGRLNSEFRHKLMERDEKALWLFGIWMGQLCRYPNVWWTRRRSRCDFRAIRLWLHLVGVDRRPGEEGDLWRHLLQDLDETWGYNFATDPIMQRALSAKYH